MLSDNSLPNMMIQSTTNNHLSIINNHCVLGPSTTVENSLQISSFMQNKANFPDDQMNVNKVLTKDYENIANCKPGENKANSKPNKANLLNDQMNVNKVLTKDYENISNWTLDENKANTNPNKANFKRGRLLVNRMAKSQQHSVDIDKWLRLIGADSVGPNTCGKLINHFGSVDRPLATSVSELAKVDPVAFKTAEQLETG